MLRNSKTLGIVLATLLLLGAITSLLLTTLFHTPDFQGLRTEVKVTIYLPDGSKGTRLFGPHVAGWVPLSQIARPLINAVVASEDTAFFSHPGIDYYELKESFKKDLQERRFARGASTLTQQVVKNVYLSREKTIWRKVRELIWAWKLDKALTKPEILVFYLNVVEWGPGIYGIQEASQHYFQVPPAQLTPKQAAFLAMLLPSPVKYHSYFAKKELTPFAQSQVKRVLRIMSRMGSIDDAAYQLALKEPLWGATGVLVDNAATDADTVDASDPALGDATTAATQQDPSESQD